MLAGPTFVLSEFSIFTYMKLENSDIENSDFLKVDQKQRSLGPTFAKSKFSNFIYCEVENFDSHCTWTMFQVGLRSPRSQSF